MTPLITLCTYVSFSFLVPGCANVALVGNGFCNDETNNPDCNYDGGDCCVVNANTTACSECVCHLIETCAAGYHPLVGNGFCNDDTNIAECDYDGGDCCGCVITEHCEDCACLSGVLDDEITNPLVGDGVCNYETNNAECSYDGGDCCSSPNMVGDAICNDETNHLGCNYDGGDCCVNVNTDSCSECNCLASGVITSPGFPGNYDNNLDMTWLIQAQMGQTIEISFLSFDVEAYSGCG